MHVGTDCSWLDERTDLNNVVGTIMITITMNLVVVSSRILHVLITYANNPCRFAKPVLSCQ